MGEVGAALATLITIVMIIYVEMKKFNANNFTYANTSQIDSK